MSVCLCLIIYISYIYKYIYIASKIKKETDSTYFITLSRTVLENLNIVCLILALTDSVERNLKLAFSM